jgi:hypothetical protein
MTACGSSDEAPSDEQLTKYAESAPPAGQAVRFHLYTHCGVESLRIDGRWWHAPEPLYGNEGPGGPPDGWGDPYQVGMLTVHSENSATFEAEDARVEFVPAPDSKPMRICR